MLGWFGFSVDIIHFDRVLQVIPGGHVSDAYLLVCFTKNMLIMCLFLFSLFIQKKIKLFETCNLQCCCDY